MADFLWKIREINNMKEKMKGFYKDVLFCSIALGIRFHLHYQIKNLVQEPEKQEKKIDAGGKTKQNRDTLAIAFNEMPKIKMTPEKTR